jgi:protein-tyrosine phosphatase
MRVRNTAKVAASPDEAWGVVGDLTGVDRWIPGVVDAQIDGTRRVCRTADGGAIVERITSYSDEARSYGYVHVEQPLPIENSRGTLSVKADGEGSLIVWEAEFHAEGPEIARMVEAAYGETLASLARVVEAQPRSP